MGGIMRDFKLVSDFQPKGDQPQAIDELRRASAGGTSTRCSWASPAPARPSRSPTSSQAVQRPTLIIVAQQDARGAALRGVQGLLPENAVEYFVSYYDYYQPEAYVPRRTRTSRRTRSINDEIDRLRLSATELALRAARRDHRGVGLAASTASARRRPTTGCWSISRKGTPPSAMRY